MANLEPMPISSLPEGDIQDGDKMIVYRDSTGKAYQSDTGALAEAASVSQDVVELKEEVEQLNADLTDVMPSKAYLNNSTVETMLNDWTAMTNQRPALFIAYQDTASFLTNGASSNLFYGIRYRNGSNLGYLIASDNNNTIYWGRIVSGAVTMLRSVSGSSISLSSVGDPVVMSEDDV